MLVEGIKSRPQYPGLVADGHAMHHVLVADGDGAQAIIDLFARDGSQIMGRVEIIYAATLAGSADYANQLSQLSPESSTSCRALRPRSSA